MYKIVFHSQGKIYELFAKKVSPDTMLAFIEIEDIVFGEHSELVVDPTEEKLKNEFAGVRRTYVPIHAVIRIDEVERKGTSRIVDADGATGNIMPFPQAFPPGQDS